jgi:ABC-2 type transport system permease protein
VRLFARQLAYEQLIFWRSREAAIFVFLLPVLLYVMLGSIIDGDVEGHSAASYLSVGMIGYGVANTAFGGLAIFLVLRRENGVLKRIRGTPLPAATYLAAVLVSMLVVFALQAAALMALGVLAFDAETPTRPVGVVLALALAAAAFAAVGLAAAAVIRSSEGASPIVNIVILPMAFLSGSFGDPDEYPAALRAVGDALPLKHAIELVQATYLDDASVWDRPRALLVLAAWTVGCVALAWRLFGWEPRSR